MKIIYLLILTTSIVTYSYSQVQHLNDSTVIYYQKTQNLTDAEVGYFYDADKTLINSYLDYSYKPKDLLYITQVSKGKKIVLRGPQLITKFDDYKFIYIYKRDFVNGNPYQEYFVISPLKGKERLKDFKGAFQKQLIETFPTYKIPKLINEEGKLNITDLESIIWLLKLEYYYKEGKLLYLDDDWNDITLSGSGEKRYYLKMDSITKSKIFLGSYDLDNNLLYNYSIVLRQPSIKNDWYHFYNKNNVLSKSIFYNFNETDSIKTYHHDGKPFENYYLDHLDFIYKSVKNKDGNDILDEHGSGSISIYDSIMNREVIKTYKNNQIKAVYYNEDNSSHFLLTEEAVSYKFFSKFSDDFNKKFKPSSKDTPGFLDGLTLIKCLVDKKGRILNASISLSANPDNDEKILNWVSTYKGKAFKPAKLDGKVQQQEVLIPIKYKAYVKDKFKIKTLY